HLVGLPEEGRERMLAWAAATFDLLGPANARSDAALPAMLEMIEYVTHVGRDRLRPDGWAVRLFDAADAGAIAPDAVAGLLVVSTAPRLDTTILGAGHLLWLLGRHPEEYERVRSDPALIPAAVHEALRLGSPVRAFTRFAATDHVAGDVVIPKGDRVL